MCSIHAAMAFAGPRQDVVDRVDAAFELEKPDVGVAHRLVAIDEAGDRRGDVARLGNARRLLDRPLPVDDGDSQVVLRSELANRRSAGSRRRRSRRPRSSPRGRDAPATSRRQLAVSVRGSRRPRRSVPSSGTAESSSESPRRLAPNFHVTRCNTKMRDEQGRLACCLLPLRRTGGADHTRGESRPRGPPDDLSLNQPVTRKGQSACAAASQARWVSAVLLAVNACRMEPRRSRRRSTRTRCRHRRRTRRRPSRARSIRSC